MSTIVVSAAGGLSNATGSYVGGVLPASGDDVQLNASSGAFTLNAAFAARSMDCTGYTGTLTHNASVTATIGDGTAGLGNIALKLVPGMTYTVGSANSSNFTFVSTSATTQTVDFAGKTTGPTVFNATTGGSWQYTGSQVQAPGWQNGSVTLVKGALDLNGQTLTWGYFISNSGSVRSLTGGAATINIVGAPFNHTSWQTTNTGFTVSMASATVNFNQQYSAGAYFIDPASFPFGTVNMNNANGNSQVNTALTCVDMTINGPSIKTYNFILAANITCSGTFNPAGNSAINRMLLVSNALGTPRTITAATVTGSNTDFMDITGAGASGWNISAMTGGSGDCGGNTGITFSTPVAQSWNTAGPGNWSDVTKWTTRVPIPQDDVLINQGFAGQTITADMPRLGKNISWAGSTGAPIWAITQSPNIMYGSLVLAGTMFVNNSGVFRFGGRGAFTVTSNGRPINVTGGVQVYAPTGSYTLLDGFSTNGTFDLNSGGWTTSGFSWSLAALASNVTSARTLNIANSTINLTSTGGVTIWVLNPASLSLTAAGSIINIAGASSATRIFNGGSANSYGTFNYNIAGSTGALTLAASGGTFSAFNFSDVTNARTLTVTAGQTVNFGALNIQGSAGKLMSIRSTTPGSQATINVSSQVSGDYLDIQDSNVTGTTPAYAGANSIDSLNNTNWAFTVPPAGGSSVGASSMLTMGV